MKEQGPPCTFLLLTIVEANDYYLSETSRAVWSRLTNSGTLNKYVCEHLCKHSLKHFYKNNYNERQREEQRAREGKRGSRRVIRDRDINVNPGPSVQVESHHETLATRGTRSSRLVPN